MNQQSNCTEERCLLFQLLLHFMTQLYNQRMNFRNNIMFYEELFDNEDEEEDNDDGLRHPDG